jgi:hypothetical protein
MKQETRDSATIVSKNVQLYNAITENLESVLALTDLKRMHDQFLCLTVRYHGIMEIEP